jgi:hypothetical protein
MLCEYTTSNWRPGYLTRSSDASKWLFSKNSARFLRNSMPKSPLLMSIELNDSHEFGCAGISYNQANARTTTACSLQKAHLDAHIAVRNEEVDREPRQVHVAAADLQNSRRGCSKTAARCSITAAVK